MMRAKDYKSDLKPIWCPGCGHYSVLSAVTKALAERQVAPEHAVMVSGIGCSSRIPAYLQSFGFHGVHGRALAVATGLKVARPDLSVIALGGDGDGFSIGGNHFLHACRRNVDLVYIVMDNEVYGMTKGQASPTSPEHWDHSKLTPHGPEMRPFQPGAIALAAGASFIARGHSGDPNGLAFLIHEAMEHRGFAFVHVLSQCVTFCPEQAEWKSLVHDTIQPTDDPVVAATNLHADDGFGKGIFFQRAREVWPPSHQPSEKADIRRSFVL